MLILLATFLAAFFVGGVTTYFFGWIPAVFPTLVIFALVYFLLARAVARRLEAAMRSAQIELQRGRIEQGIRILEDLKHKFGKLQFFVASSLDGQIGSIYYMRQDFERARPFLQRAFSRHWIAKGMLGVLMFRKKDYTQMDKVFDGALRYSPKQGLLWSLWAYCHWKAGHLDRAMEILVKGQQKLGDADLHLLANLKNLQNQKKMKMRAYGEQWYQFLLEVPPQVRQMQSRQVRMVGR